MYISLHWYSVHSKRRDTYLKWLAKEKHDFTAHRKSIYRDDKPNRFKDIRLRALLWNDFLPTPFRTDRRYRERRF